MSSLNDFVIENGELKEYTGRAENVEIPEGVTRIGDRAFWRCSSLQWVVIPEGVTSIGTMAFGSCGLQSVVIPESVTSIGDRAFENCKSLQSVVIPEGVISIGKMAFKGCDKLADPSDFIIVNNILFGYLGDKDTIVIPEGVTRID